MRRRLARLVCCSAFPLIVTSAAFQVEKAFGGAAALAVADLLLAVPAAVVIGFRSWVRRGLAGRAPRTLRGGRTEGATLAITRLAVFLAGPRHAHLREAWAADLYGDPEAGELPSARRRIRLAAGFVMAALRCRLDDAVMLAWRPVDATLASWHGSRLAILLPVTVAAGMVLSRDGFYGLIANAENLGVIATAPYLAIKGLRKYRQIDTPKRLEKKASSTESTKQ